LRLSEVLDDLQSQNLVFESIELSDEEVRIFDLAAILTGKSRTPYASGSDSPALKSVAGVAIPQSLH
jgi:hypothetical protein